MTEDAAVVNDVGAIGHGERFAHVVIGDQHADAAGPQATDNFLQVENGDGIDAGKWFVEEDEGWIDAQAARNFHAAALSAGKRVATILPDVLQAKFIDKFFHLLAALVPGHRLSFKNCENIFLNREFAKDRSFLWEIADAILARPKIHGNISDVLTVIQHAAGIRGDQANDGVERGGFAGAVGTK